MGNLLRHYWQPVLLSNELPEPDSGPLRVRLLGEDLVAFRDSSGRLGLLGNHCPHRGASLFFGRNEENGLRCVYHGWKLDVSGACVDMPSEPPESSLKDKIRHTAYPVVERNGVAWVYMGPQRPAPPLPAVEWNLVPPEQCYVSVRGQQNNWVQALEGEIDPSHAGFLHAWLNEDENINNFLPIASRGPLYRARDRHPRVETADTDAGVTIAARRNAEEDSYYWRIYQFLFPFYTVIPPYGADPTFTGHAWVPIDDEQVLALCFTYHPVRPLTDAELNTLRQGLHGVESVHASVDAFLPPSSEPFGRWRPKQNRENLYGMDREAQRTMRYSGVPGVWPQDSACQETMGPIVDRGHEHLASTDTGIIRVRRRLIAAANALREEGVLPPGSQAPESFRVRSASLVLPRTDPWLAGAAEVLTAPPGVNFAAA
jgi:phenylpropionate dioxygenase-like ring-hydroxylating dioxygenase large terminal subunit